MAIRSYKSSAWQDIGTLKVPVSGAYQTASSAKALVSSAWQDVWSAGTYFLKAGVLQSGVKLGSDAHQASGSIQVYIGFDGYTELTALYNIKLTSDMVGKKIYVKTSSNVTAYSTGTSDTYLYMKYPNSSGYNSIVYSTKNSAGLHVFDVPNDYNYSTGSIGFCVKNIYGMPLWVYYYFYDIYVA